MKTSVFSFCFHYFVSLINSYYVYFFSAVDFFNQINMLYGTITEFCTEESCPIMSAGPKYEYHWADGHTVKKPIKCSAPKYIDYLMTWVQDQLDDETLFPSKIGNYFIFSSMHQLFQIYELNFQSLSLQEYLSRKISYQLQKLFWNGYSEYTPIFIINISAKLCSSARKHI